MMLKTASGEFPVPPEVARRLPSMPDIPGPGAGDREQRAFRDWLDASSENLIAYERLRRWHLVQEDLAARARRDGKIHVVTDDGLD